VVFAMRVFAEELLVEFVLGISIVILVLNLMNG